MIDSTDKAVIEKALKYSQGKAIINSINLEDGEERFADILPLIKRFGGALVVGTIDETGMAVTAEKNWTSPFAPMSCSRKNTGFRHATLFLTRSSFPLEPVMNSISAPRKKRLKASASSKTSCPNA